MSAFVMMAGGIDLTVGSVFALCNLAALLLINSMEVNLAVRIPAIMVLGGVIGLINGLLIGYLGMRAFLTTLVMLIIVRAVVDQGLLDYGQIISRGFNASAAWEFMAIGKVFGVPSSLVVAAAIALVGHIVLTRMRFGWHVMAVGGSRRSAYNAGIKVKRTICLTYVLSGVLTGLAATFYAARLSSAATTGSSRRPKPGGACAARIIASMLAGGERQLSQLPHCSGASSPKCRSRIRRRHPAVSTKAPNADSRARSPAWRPGSTSPIR